MVNKAKELAIVDELTFYVVRQCLRIVSFYKYMVEIIYKHMCSDSIGFNGWHQAIKWYIEKIVDKMSSMFKNILTRIKTVLDNLFMKKFLRIWLYKN